MFARACEFVAGVARLDQLPVSRLPEIAFAGRSNVGKSSLINALTGRKTLVRVSNTPGRTREINFFDLGQRLMLVDLPGYGFAKVSKTEAARWTELVFAYLRGRPQLKRAILLVDSRRGLTQNDRDAMELLDKSAVSYQIVLTKADKLKPDERDAVEEAVFTESKRHAAAYPAIVATSSVSGLGIPELRTALAALANR